jgi:hypothetical protein
LFRRKLVFLVLWLKRLSVSLLRFHYTAINNRVQPFVRCFRSGCGVSACAPDRSGEQQALWHYERITICRLDCWVLLPQLFCRRVISLHWWHLFNLRRCILRPVFGGSLARGGMVGAAITSCWLWSSFCAWLEQFPRFWFRFEDAAEPVTLSPELQQIAQDEHRWFLYVILGFSQPLFSQPLYCKPLIVH